MPRKPQHALAWSRDRGLYELHTQGHAVRRFAPGDAEDWRGWLGGVTAFAFRGQSGGLNVHQEVRPRGGRYWYAYAAAGGRARKRYLGPSARVSLALLEEVAAALAPPPTPPPVVPIPDAALALPAAKLAPPQAPPALVARAGPLDALDAAFAIPLTLVAAPAGWGKTTALAAWARRHPARVAWLALEASDDEPVRFWSVAIAALRARIPGVGATALALLRAPQPPPLAAVVTALLNELDGATAGAAPLVLVLDDYHAIGDPAIRASLSFLLGHLPVGLRLIIAGRADPDLPLARLRARGQLAEIRAADLRFTAEDTAAFMRGALDAPLAGDAVAALVARTEGWAAGVQLAALALRGQTDRAAWLAGFSGGHRFLLDYVEEEILAQQPPAIRNFLLRVAVLPRLNADLCAAVTGAVDSGAILAGLERQNLFVIPLDEGRRWYRLHDLFREALLARAAAEPGLLTDAHGRAARWHADHGDGRAAIGYALVGGDHRFAADLIAREAPRLWLGGEARTVLGWLLALPDAVLWRHARLALDAALRLLSALHAVAGVAYADPRAQVDRLLARIEAGLHTSGEPVFPSAEAALLRRRLHLLRAFGETRHLLDHGDGPRLAALAEEVAGLAADEEIPWQMVGHGITFWLTFSIRHEGPGLIPQLRALERRALDVGEHLSALRAMLWLALAHQQAGESAAVERVCLEGLAFAARRDMHTAATGYLHLALGLAYYAQDRLDEASGTLDAALRTAQTWQQMDLHLWSHLQLARLALAGGNPDIADRTLREAEETVRRERLAVYEHDVGAARAGYWLATGDLTRATAWAVRVALDPETLTPAQHGAALALARVALARREYPQALAILDRFAAHLDRPGNALATADYLALRLVASHHAGAREEARAVAARLFALTEPAGWTRVYLDEGAPMARTLAALRAAPDGGFPDIPAPPAHALARLLAAFAGERRAGAPPMATGAGEPTALPSPARAAPALVEPLTAREMEVLRLLAAGASNGEIAAALSISPATAKKHVGNLLGKLGATNRTAAVARARDAALL